MLMIVVGIFAIIGALLRDGVGEITSLWWSGIFPFATLIVNLAGCFILGWFTTHIKKLESVHPYIKTGVGTGLVGSFTTFSTFSVETIQLFDSGHLALGFIYLFVSFAGGWAFAFLGFSMGDFIFMKKEGEYR